jgi:hypothetical protein
MGLNRHNNRGSGGVFMRHLRLPLDDYVAALDACLDGFQARRVGVIVASVAVSWWLYVPIHELAHVLGCILSGGTVTRLEIDPLYGGVLLQQVFSFVAVGSDYAGQLTGFDTGGRDLTYLATDFCPFLLTIFIGVPLLRWVSREKTGEMRACVKLGASLPLAYAPFISLAGDYYEMGSVVISRLGTFVMPSFDRERWRSDDVIELVRSLYAASGSGGLLDAMGIGLSLALGVAFAFTTYWLGAQWSDAAIWRRKTA